MILVVDDEATIRSLTGSILRQAGYEVHEAGSGEEALRMLEAEIRQPNLLLTDIVMPGVNGLTLAARIHHSYPDLGVLFMSGYASEYEDELSGSICLQKPFKPAQLLAAVEDVLRARAHTH